MSAIGRFKEYFGMAPVPYEDDYLDDYDRPSAATLGRPARGEGYSDREPRARYRDDEYGDLHERHDRHERSTAFDERHELGDTGDYGRDYRPRASHRDADTAERPEPTFRMSLPEEPAARPSRASSSRGSVALDPAVEDFDDGLVTEPETAVLRLREYADAKSLGDEFRAGKAVVLDLSALPREEAMRLIDFAAGLIVGLDGSMQKVTGRERTFFLQQAGSDLTEAEVRDAVSEAFRR